MNGTEPGQFLYVDFTNVALRAFFPLRMATSCLLQFSMQRGFCICRGTDSLLRAYLLDYGTLLNLSPHSYKGVFDHFWSLSLEEQFYLFWPGCLVLLGKTNAKRLAWVMVITLPFLRLASYMLFPKSREQLGGMFHTYVTNALGIPCRFCIPGRRAHSLVQESLVWLDNSRIFDIDDIYFLGGRPSRSRCRPFCSAHDLSDLCRTVDSLAFIGTGGHRPSYPGVEDPSVDWRSFVQFSTFGSRSFLLRSLRCEPSFR